MKLSIITCSYNSEKFIAETLDSVASQNISNNHSIEHVILDGFSSDATIEIANTYKKNTEWKIDVVIQQSPAKGIFNAFNEWIKISTWDYVLVLPSDDFLEPGVLGEYLDFIESTGSLDLYYAKRNTYNHDLRKNIGVPYPNRSIYFHGLSHLILGLSCYISQPTVIARRDLHERFGFYNEELRLVADWEFYIKLSLAKVSSKFYDRVVTNFRVHEGSATTGKINAVSLGKKEEIDVFTTYYKYMKYLFIPLRKFYRKYFY